MKNFLRQENWYSRRRENNTSSKSYFIPKRVNRALFVSHTNIQKNYFRKTLFKFFLSFFFCFGFLLTSFFLFFFFSVPLLQSWKKKKVRIWEKIQSLRLEIGFNLLKRVLYSICTGWEAILVFFPSEFLVALICIYV